ncbi:hypothetical protein KY305_13545 [Bacillus sp. YC2]|nr:hypothetical protein [Bacillus sp. YC2]MBY8913763.1 hypothetical protein [Bacillus sp. YC2]
MPESWRLFIVSVFYDSFGFESKDNPYSSVTLSAKDWVMVKELFFSWVIL